MCKLQWAIMYMSKKFQKSILIIIALGLLACNSDKTTSAANDTADILEASFSTRKLITEIPLNQDTICILRSKLVNNSFPEKLNELTVSYIPDTGSNRSKNRRWEPYEPHNNRLRFEVTKMDIKPDSAEVKVYYFNFVVEFTVKLKKINDRWKVSDIYMIIE